MVIVSALILNLPLFLFEICMSQHRSASSDAKNNDHTYLFLGKIIQNNSMEDKNRCNDQMK